MERRYLRIKEVLEYLGISRTALYGADIPHIKINGIVLYDIHDIDRYLAKRKVTR